MEADRYAPAFGEPRFLPAAKQASGTSQRPSTGALNGSGSFTAAASFKHQYLDGGADWWFQHAVAI